jgi:hypothetical protein
MTTILSLSLFLVMAIAGVFSGPWAFAFLSLHFSVEQCLQASTPFFLSNGLAVNAAAATIAGLSAIREWATRGIDARSYFNAVWIGSVCIFVWSLVTLAWSPAAASGWRFAQDGLPYVVTFLLAGPALIRDVQEAGKFARIYLVAGVLIAVAVKLSPAFTTQSGRLGIVLDGKLATNPLELGEIGALVILAATLVRAERFPGPVLLLRIAGLLLGALICAESGSRGQIVFAVLISLFFFPISRTVRNVPGFIAAVIASVVLVVGLSFFAANVLPERVAARWDIGQIEGGVGERTQNIGEIFVYWLSRPQMWPIGLGFDAFDAVSVREGYSHILTLDILFELGFAATLLYVWMLFRTVRAGVSLFRRHRESPRDRSTVAFLLASLALQFLLSNKQGALWSSWGIFMSMILICRIDAYEAAEEGPIRGGPD